MIFWIGLLAWAIGGLFTFFKIADDDISSTEEPTPILWLICGPFAWILWICYEVSLKVPADKLRATLIRKKNTD